MYCVPSFWLSQNLSEKRFPTSRTLRDDSLRAGMTDFGTNFRVSDSRTDLTRKMLVIAGIREEKALMQHL